MSDESKIVTVRGADGTAYQIDEHNNTVTYADGRKVDFREVDMAQVLDRAMDYQKRTLNVADVHTNAILSNFMVNYGSQIPDMIADLACPPLLVSKPSDTYYTLSKNNRFRQGDTTMAGEDSPIQEFGPSVTTATYTTKAYGAAANIPQGVEAAADAPLRPLMISLEMLLNRMATAREVRVAAALLNGTTFSSYTTGKSTSNFWDTISGSPTSSDPIGDIIAGEEAMDVPLTHVAMSKKSWNRFINNPNVYNKIGLYVKDNVLAESPDNIAAKLSSYFGGVRFLVGAMKAESTTPGTTTLSYVWDDDVILLHIPPGAGQNEMVVPTARTFRWNKDGASRLTNGFRVRQWFDPNRGQDGSTKVAVLCNEAHVVVAANAGYLYTNVW